LGAACRLGTRVAIRAAATAMLGSPQVASYGGDLDVGIAF